MSPPSSLLRAELEAGSGAVPSQTAAVEEKKKPRNIVWPHEVA